jgi:hypothetical protein
MGGIRNLFLFYIIGIEMNENNLKYTKIKRKILVLLKGVMPAIKGKSWEIRTMHKCYLFILIIACTKMWKMN